MLHGSRLTGYWVGRAPVHKEMTSARITSSRAAPAAAREIMRLQYNEPAYFAGVSFTDFRFISASFASFVGRIIRVCNPSPRSSVPILVVFHDSSPPVDSTVALVLDSPTFTAMLDP